MSCEKSTCNHLNEVIDEHEGSFVCLDCGLVLSPFFDQRQNFICDQKADGDIKEFLHRINLPLCYLDEKNITCETKKDKQFAGQLYDVFTGNQKVITIKEFSSVTGVTEKNILKQK